MKEVLCFFYGHVIGIHVSFKCFYDPVPYLFDVSCYVKLVEYSDSLIQRTNDSF